MPMVCVFNIRGSSNSWNFRLTTVLPPGRVGILTVYVCCFNFLPLGRPVWEGISLLLFMTDVFTSTGKEKFLLNISQMLVTSVAFGLEGFTMCRGITVMLPRFHTNLRAFVLLRFGSLQDRLPFQLGEFLHSVGIAICPPFMKSMAPWSAFYLCYVNHTPFTFEHYFFFFQCSVPHIVHLVEILTTYYWQG